MVQATERPSAALAPVSSAETYPLADFKRRTGLGDWGMRQARKNGLRVAKVGKRRFVRGVDWFEFLGRTGETHA